MKTRETGLLLYPADYNARAIQDVIANSEFYTEYNSEYGCYIFPEEEECYDDLEAQIDNLFAGTNLNYRIEGIF